MGRIEPYRRTACSAGGWQAMRVPLANWFRLAVLVVCLSGTAAGQSDSSTDTFQLGPPIVNGQVVVDASFQLLGISEIDDEAEKIAFSGVLTLQWQNPQQSFDPNKSGVNEKVYSGTYQFHEIATVWHPQVTLANPSGQYDGRAIILRVKPDGTCTLSETIEAVARVDLNMRRFPFDQQRLGIVFVPVGLGASEIVFQANSTATSNFELQTNVPQWTLENVDVSTRTLNASTADDTENASALVVTMDLNRQPLFMLRLVVLPLGLIVVLSWSVFWMDRSSLGDRMSVSFVGILTAVAYQIMLVGIVPNVSYVTLMNGFLNLSFLLMSATVVINLVVGAADKHGQQRGDRVDWHCRWIFPLAYFALNAILLAVAFLVF